LRSLNLPGTIRSEADAYAHIQADPPLTGPHLRQAIDQRFNDTVETDHNAGARTPGADLGNMASRSGTAANPLNFANATLFWDTGSPGETSSSLRISPSAFPTSGPAPLKVSFSAMTLGGPSTYTYSWHFGDSTTGSGTTVSQTYSVAGSYPASLTVADSHSHTATALKTTIITGPTYYVDNANGTDNWSGTLAAPNESRTDGPFRTLSKAKSMMEGGAIKTTTIREGTYSIASNFTLSSLDVNETWLPYFGENVILDGGGNGYMQAIGANGLTIEGLTLQHLTRGPQGAGLALSGSNYTVRWNTFLNCFMECISGGDVQHALIDSNTLNGQSPGNPSGSTGIFYPAILFWSGSSNNTISHNLIENTQGGGIQFSTGPTDAAASNNVIDRNLLKNVDTNVVDSGAIDIYDAAHNGTGNQITNNLIFGNNTNFAAITKGIYLDNLTSNVKVSGNICNKCGTWAVFLHCGDHNTITNNIFDVSTLATGSIAAMIGVQDGAGCTSSNGMAGNSFSNNIVYTSGNFPALWWVSNQGGDSLPTDNTNDYFSATGAAMSKTAVVDTSPHNINPGFTNPSANDYSMSPSSQVHSLISFPSRPTMAGPMASPFISQ